MADYKDEGSGSDVLGADKRLLFKRLPPVLTIALRRFEHPADGPSKREDKVVAPHVLDIPVKLFSPDTVEHGPVRYDLHHVVHHESFVPGASDGGHYTSYGRLDATHWYRHDDMGPSLRTLTVTLAQDAIDTGYLRQGPAPAAPKPKGA